METEIRRMVKLMLETPDEHQLISYMAPPDLRIVYPVDGSWTKPAVGMALFFEDMAKLQRYAYSNVSDLHYTLWAFQAEVEDPYPISQLAMVWDDDGLDEAKSFWTWFLHATPEAPKFWQPKHNRMYAPIGTYGSERFRLVRPIATTPGNDMSFVDPTQFQLRRIGWTKPFHAVEY